MELLVNCEKSCERIEIEFVGPNGRPHFSVHPTTSRCNNSQFSQLEKSGTLSLKSREFMKTAKPIEHTRIAQPNEFTLFMLDKYAVC